jgi:hypothetical protein
MHAAPLARHALSAPRGPALPAHHIGVVHELIRVNGCGMQGDATYLIVQDDGTLANYGVNAVCTHLGCVVPWNKVAPSQSTNPPSDLPHGVYHPTRELHIHHMYHVLQRARRSGLHPTPSAPSRA